MKQSRFDDDHHNTESIEQLFNHKINGNTSTFRSKASVGYRVSIPSSEDKYLTSNKQSLES